MAQRIPRWRGGNSGFVWWLLSAFLLVAALTWSYRTVPTGNTTQDRFDAILVLGAPTTLRGDVSEEQRWRVEEGVREFRVGRAPRILFSGGAVAYRFVEAEAMAGYARKLGVPPDAILTEVRARNTIENIGYSDVILKAHDWRSVEVISSRDHLPRAALILRKTQLRWRVHAAPSPGRSCFDWVLFTLEESITTSLLRWFGFGIMPVLHLFARAQGALGWSLRWVWYHLTGQVQRLG